MKIRNTTAHPIVSIEIDDILHLCFSRNVLNCIYAYGDSLTYPECPYVIELLFKGGGIQKLEYSTKEKWEAVLEILYTP